MRRVMLVGATSGIGLELARLYAAAGWHVGILGRNPERLSAVREELGLPDPLVRVETRAADVLDHSAAASAFDALLGDLGHMDLFVYCAGVQAHGDGVSADAEGERETFEVNTVAAAHLLGRAADYFRLARRGHIAAIGSVAGERGRKGNPAYTASKAGLHAYLEGLRARLHPFGVTVSTAKPGFVNTPMLAGRASGRLVTEPARAARLIARGLARRRESFYVPWWWSLVALVLRLLPRPVFKRFGPP